MTTPIRQGCPMVVVVALAAIGSAVALGIAVIIGSGIVAWMCVGLSAIGLLLLTVDAMRERGRTNPASVTQALPAEHQHTAGDELFGERELERDATREERVINPDMLGRYVPYEEAVEDIRRAGQGPGKHDAGGEVKHEEDTGGI
jgi:hypothetical protein